MLNIASLSSSDFGSSSCARDDMRELTDTLPVAVYTTDVTGRITHFNEAAAFLWGR